VLRGLRLANSHLGIIAMGLFYVLWVLICVVLCFVLIPFAVSGKSDTFNNAVNSVVRYAFLLPLALLGATTWAVKLYSRFLWCAIPEPLTATLFACVSVAGRLSVLVGAGFLWIWGGPFGQGLLRPEAVACAGVAWLGLIADWAFIRTLRLEFPLEEEAARPYSGSRSVAGDAFEQRVTEPTKKIVFTRQVDLGAWFKSRFPRAHKLVVWVLAPVFYVAVSSLADNGDPRAIPQAIFRMAVIAPLILQVFWIPGPQRLKELLSRADRLQGNSNRF
jgi:hypothetical protein